MSMVRLPLTIWNTQVHPRAWIYRRHIALVDRKYDGIHLVLKIISTQARAVLAVLLACLCQPPLAPPLPVMCVKGLHRDSSAAFMKRPWAASLHTWRAKAKRSPPRQKKTFTPAFSLGFFDGPCTGDPSPMIAASGSSAAENWRKGRGA